MTDNGPLTWTYFFAAVGYAASLFLIPLLVRALIVTVTRWRDRRTRHHNSRALNVRYLPRQETSR